MRGDLKAEGRTEVAAQAEGVKAKEIKKLVEGRMRIEGGWGGAWTTEDKM